MKHGGTWWHLSTLLCIGAVALACAESETAGHVFPNDPAVNQVVNGQAVKLSRKDWHCHMPAGLSFFEALPGFPLLGVHGVSLLRAFFVAVPCV